MAGGHAAARGAPVEPGPGPAAAAPGQGPGPAGCAPVPQGRGGDGADRAPGAVRLSRCALPRAPAGFPGPAVPWWRSWPFPRFRTAALGIRFSYFLEYEFVYFQKRTNVKLIQYLRVGRFLVEE